MTTQEAIKILERLQEPEPYEPQITHEAYEALEMAIEALEMQEKVPKKHGDLIDRNMLWNDIFVTGSGVKIPLRGRDGQAIKIPLASLGQIIRKQPTVIGAE